MEGVLRDGLEERGIAPSRQEACLEVASRTDRGVSARGNALTIRSNVSGGSLLQRLNAISPKLFFTEATPVPADFRVRGAVRRIYRYFDPGKVRHRELCEAAAQLFQGRLDARSFGRAVPVSRPLWRTVESVRLRPRDEGAEIEVHAPSFVWGMVRKIVGALREVDQGRLPLDRLSSAIAGKERLTLPLAEPEGLVLWDVQYPAIVWETHWRGANRHQASHWRDTRRALWSRTEVLACITGEADLSAPGTRVG